METMTILSQMIGTTSIIFLFGIIAGEWYIYTQEKEKWKQKKKKV